MWASFISLKVTSSGGLCVYGNEHLTFSEWRGIFPVALRLAASLQTPLLEFVGCWVVCWYIKA